MKILVTGGAGYIGSHTCVELLNAGYEIVVVDNFDNSCMQSIETIKAITGKDFPFYEVDLLDYVAVVDCGTPINPNLVKVQTEGGLVQGIGMALSEGVTYTDKGRIIENSFMQYKVPTRVDISRIRVFFESSWEPTGPFGAKSVGEIVINTPSPAIAHAIYRATGAWHRTLPITPEKVWRGTTENSK